MEKQPLISYDSVNPLCKNQYQPLPLDTVDSVRSRPFFQRHSDFQCVIFDKDLKTLYRLVDTLYRFTSDMKNRFQHKETTLVAKSVFDYALKRDLYLTTPQVFYDFRYHDTRIFLFRTKKTYHVMSLGFKPSDKHRQFSVDVYGTYSRLSPAIVEFISIVQEFLDTCDLDEYAEDVYGL